MSHANPVSDDLVWLLTRKQTAYIHKRRGAGRTFSVERGNLKVRSTACRLKLGLGPGREVEMTTADVGRGD
jgi:hypothetical protein